MLDAGPCGAPIIRLQLLMRLLSSVCCCSQFLKTPSSLQTCDLLHLAADSSHRICTSSVR